MVDNKIGERLEDYFAKQGLDYKAVANILGTSAQYVNGLFKGRTGIGKRVAKKLCEKFPELSESFLLIGDGNVTRELHDDNQRAAIYRSVIDKANRLHAVSAYLINEGQVNDFVGLANKIDVDPNEIDMAISCDPDCHIDYVFLKIAEVFPNLNVMWLFTGDGEMVNEDSLTSTNTSLPSPELSALRSELNETNQDIRVILQRVTEIYDKICPNAGVQPLTAAEHIQGE